MEFTKREKLLIRYGLANFREEIFGKIHNAETLYNTDRKVKILSDYKSQLLEIANLDKRLED